MDIVGKFQDHCNALHKQYRDEDWLRSVTPPGELKSVLKKNAEAKERAEKADQKVDFMYDDILHYLNKGFIASIDKMDPVLQPIAKEIKNMSNEELLVTFQRSCNRLGIEVKLESFKYIQDGPGSLTLEGEERDVCSVRTHIYTHIHTFIIKNPSGLLFSV
jgi:hypothetical protein